MIDLVGIDPACRTLLGRQNEYRSLRKPFANVAHKRFKIVECRKPGKPVIGDIIFPEIEDDPIGPESSLSM